MALTLVVEDGTGKADANSYATKLEADDYFYAHLFASVEYNGESTERREAALAMVTRVIDAEIQFYGQKKTAAQALQWPRVGCPEPDDPVDGDGYVPDDCVPRRVKEACCEMVLEFFKLDRFNYVGEGISFKQTSIDVSTTYSKRDIPEILTRMAIHMLSRYGVAVTQGSGVVKLQRA